MVWILLSGLPLGESSDHTFQSLWISDRYWWRKSSLETGLSPATGLTKEFSRHVAIPQLNTIFFLTGTWQGALVPDKLSQSFLWQAIISHQPELGNHFPKAVAVWRAVEVKPPRLPQLLCHCARKSRSQIYSGSCMQSRKQLPKWNKQNKKSTSVEHRMIMGCWTDFLLQTSDSCLDWGAISANILLSLFLLWKKYSYPGSWSSNYTSFLFPKY